MGNSEWFGKCFGMWETKWTVRWGQKVAGSECQGNDSVIYFMGNGGG